MPQLLVGGFLLNNTSAANTNRAASIFSANTSVVTYGNSALYAQRGTGSLANTFLYNGIATSITGVAASTQGFGLQEPAKLVMKLQALLLQVLQYTVSALTQEMQVFF